MNASSLSLIAVASGIIGAGSVATAQTTFDHNRSIAITTPAGATGGELLTEGFPGPPVVAITNAMIGLAPGDDIDALSFGNDVGMTGFHQIVFSVDTRIPAFPVLGSGVDFENTVGTAPGVPPEACGDLFLQVPTGPTCSNVLSPGGLGYFVGTATGDEANASWVTPCSPGSADDLDAFEFSAPAVALTTGVYFSLAPGSPSLGTIPATPGDILYSPLGGGPVTIATLAGIGPATDVNLGIAGRNLDALCVVAAAPGVIATGTIGPTPCNPQGCPSGCSHLVLFSITNFMSPFVFLPGDVLGVNGAGNVVNIVNAGLMGLCPSPLGCGAFGDLDNLNALEIASAAGLPAVGTTFDHDHGQALTAAGVAGDLLTEGFPGPPNVSLPFALIGLVAGDEIDAVSFGDDFLIGQTHTVIFSVDAISAGLLGSGVDIEVTAGTPPSLPLPGPNPAEACGDLFSQVFVVPGVCTNVVAPAGLGYATPAGTGDEFNATWASPNVFGMADDLDAFDYSPAATALVTGIYFSLAPGSPSLMTIPATPGDILYSTVSGPGSVTIATLAGVGFATDVVLGIPDLDLDALNCIALAPGVIAAGPIGPTPCSAGGGTHLVEFSVFYNPGPFSAADVLGHFGPGAAGVLVPAAGLGLCTIGACGNDPGDNLNALEDPSGFEPVCFADLNGDGVVATADLLELLSAWGSKPGGPPDFNGDGTVGTADLLFLLSSWGRC